MILQALLLFSLSLSLSLSLSHTHIHTRTHILHYYYYYCFRLWSCSVHCPDYDSEGSLPDADALVVASSAVDDEQRLARHDVGSVQTVH